MQLIIKDDALHNKRFTSTVGMPYVRNSSVLSGIGSSVRNFAQSPEFL